MRALVVEDEEQLGQVPGRPHLRIGMPSDVGRTGGKAVALAALASYDIILLDRRLSDGEGRQAIPSLRRHGPDVPILMLTALDGVDSRIEGLDAGVEPTAVRGVGRMLTGAT